MHCWLLSPVLWDCDGTDLRDTCVILGTVGTADVRGSRCIVSIIRVDHLRTEAAMLRYVTFLRSARVIECVHGVEASRAACQRASSINIDDDGVSFCFPRPSLPTSGDEQQLTELSSGLHSRVPFSFQFVLRNPSLPHGRSPR